MTVQVLSFNMFLVLVTGNIMLASDLLRNNLGNYLLAGNKLSLMMPSNSCYGVANSQLARKVTLKLNSGS